MCGLNGVLLPQLISAVRTGLLVGLLAGIGRVWAQKTPTDSGSKPDENRFTPVVLTQGTLDEPMVFEVLKDGRVFIAERKGTVKVYDPSLPGVKTVGTLAVNTKGNNEQGLVGMTIDPGFTTNGWMYLYYFHPTDAKGVFSRWQVRNDVLVANSEKVLFDFPAQRETCCHTGGGTAWDAQGNLFITIGNDTGNNLSAHTDERPGRASWDDQRGAANTASLEGKILRIHPNPDGGYSIPQGNLFPPGTAKTRPEIFTMGHRNAWRVSVDSSTGYVYWGEVGPDAQQDTEIGPRGYDELNQARAPGFFGWPYFVGDSAFPWFDYATSKPGEKKDPRKPLNTSPNNTGLTELPPLAPSFIYYPYAISEKFPEVGSGGRSATGGPIYRQADRPQAKRPWPAYFEGKWIATDLSRRWFMRIAMAENGDYQSMERFLRKYRPVEPIDLKFGPEGDLYVLEYGGRWFQYSPEAKLVRIEYEAGNRKPVAVASADKKGGVPPFSVQLSAEGTTDVDGDALKYRWEIFEGGPTPRSFETATPLVQFARVGPVVARLTVTDPSGATDSKSVSIVSGNEPPVVSLQLMGNQSFYFGQQPIGYSVSVSDREDGTLASGQIPADKVILSVDYATQGFDLAMLQQLPTGEAAAARFPVAQALIAKGNCRACHLVEGKLVGPGFTQIAEKYQRDAEAPERLARKVISGGNGVWGEVAMPPNTLVVEAEASSILKYVLSLAQTNHQSLPLSGTYAPEIPVGDVGRGSLIWRAVYTDQGEEGLPPLTSEQVLVLRNSTLAVAQAEILKGLEVGERGTTAKAGTHLAFRQLDLTGVQQIEVAANAARRDGQLGGEIEIHLDSPTGELVGRARVEIRDLRAGGVPSAAVAEAAGAAAAVAVSGGSTNRPARPPRPPGGGPGAGRPPVVVDLEATQGRHDLYFVFGHATAKTTESLFALSTVKFLNKKTPPPTGVP